MHLALWIAAGVLATIALIGGTTKTFIPRQKLATFPGGEWTAYASDGVVRAIGVLELLAAAGLLLPAIVGVAPVLVPITAACWVALMIGAMITHGRLGQFRLALVNAVYLALAAFIAWGRFGPEPLTA